MLSIGERVVAVENCFLLIERVTKRMTRPPFEIIFDAKVIK